MMGATPRRPGSSGGVASSSNGIPSISIRTPRAGSFNPSRRPVLLRFSPRLVIFALIATICGLWTLLSSRQASSTSASSFFSSSLSSPERPDPRVADDIDNAAAYREDGKTGSPLPEMVHHDTPIEQRPHRDQQQKALPNIRGQQLAEPIAHVGPAVTASLEEASVPPKSTSSKKPNPFDTYLCAGDEWQVDEDNVYTKPFRFHVYQNMPDHLLKDVMERAAHWWQPDNA